ncbi:MAG: TIM-barrel domain-containing protein [Thermodesulfobacteriota bacterium]
MAGEPTRFRLIRNKLLVGQIHFPLPNAVRITWARNGSLAQARFAPDVLLPRAVPPEEKVIDLNSDPDARLGICSPELRLVFEQTANKIDLHHHKEGAFFRQNMPSPHSQAGISLEVDTDVSEAFYGFGEWFNGFRRQSGRLTLHNQESPSFLQHKRTYSAFPLFLSEKGYLLLVLNAHPGEAIINQPPGRLVLNFDGGCLDYIIVYGPSFKRILRDYTGLTGRPPLPPLWAFGLWNTSYPVESQDQTLKRVREHRSRGMPLDVIVLDYHWEEAFHNFKWRRRLFPDPPFLIRSLRENGVKLGLIYTPYINKGGLPLFKILARLYAKNAPDGVPFFSVDAATEVFGQAQTLGFLAHPNVTWWLGRGGAMDFTNPAAVEWWFNLQKPLLDEGVYFFKNDGGEYLPPKSKSFKGLEPDEYHNLYGFYYAKALYEKLQKHHGRERALIFSRTTWAGQQRYPAVFLGDQTPEFKHIAATMRCGLNMSLAGFAYWGADVFGLYRRPRPELHRRYSQWTLFNPIARYFSAPDVPERDPWGLDQECEGNFRRHVELRLRLRPHYYRLAYLAYTQGLPLIRPLCLEFQDDPEAGPIWSQAMIGEALMIAPVLKPGPAHRATYFPEGKWYSWWDDRPYQGAGWHKVEIASDQVPLFVRGGCPLLLSPVLQFIPHDHSFSELEIHYYPPWEGKTFLYEDDGLTLDYQQGAFGLQGVSCRREADRCAILATVEPALGFFEARPATRKVTFVFHDLDPVEGVQYLGEQTEPRNGASPGWNYEHPLRRLTIRTEVSVKEGISCRVVLKRPEGRTDLLP